MLDQFEREIDYLRISITDRCNLRCQYCMPQGVKLKLHQDIISYEEIESFCRLMTKLGFKKIKITGGEPLVRKDCAKLIKKLKQIPGIEVITMTTNGILLKKYLDELLEAGLDAVNISLDTLNPKHYKEITGFDCFDQVMESIKACVRTSLKVKINCVAFEGNEDWKEVITLAKRYPIDVRFIELMPIGLGRKYKTLDNRELLAYLKTEYQDVKKDERVHGNGPASYYTVADFRGSIGFIGAIHGQFCDSCNRVRLSSQGDLKCCLCFNNGINVLDVLHQNITDEEKIAIFHDVIYAKPKEHCFKDIDKMTEDHMMSSIGG